MSIKNTDRLRTMLMADSTLIINCPFQKLWDFKSMHACSGFPRVLVVKNLPANTGDIRDMGLIPGLGRCPGERHSNPFQYSCLENPMDRGAWRATVRQVTKSQA